MTDSPSPSVPPTEEQAFDWNDADQVRLSLRSLEAAAVSSEAHGNRIIPRELRALAAALPALVSASEDSRRLDWLERQIPTASSGGYRLKSWREAPEAPRYYLVGDSAIIEDDHFSLREAIDAAMRQSSAPGAT